MVRVQKKRDGSTIAGIVGSKPPHYQSEAERKSVPDISSLFIDIGASSKQHAIEMGAEVASPVIPEATCTYNPETKLLFGKAFDCRLGCSTILDVLEDLQEEALDVNLVAGFASQEEVGCRGAQLTAKKVNPDVAICFEGSPADDTFLPPYQQQTIVGKGPMLRFIDSKMITNPRFQRFALDQAEKTPDTRTTRGKKRWCNQCSCTALVWTRHSYHRNRYPRQICTYTLGDQQHRGRGKLNPSC